MIDLGKIVGQFVALADRMLGCKARLLDQEESRRVSKKLGLRIRGCLPRCRGNLAKPASNCPPGENRSGIDTGLFQHALGIAFRVSQPRPLRLNVGGHGFLSFENLADQELIELGESCEMVDSEARMKERGFFSRKVGFESRRAKRTLYDGFQQGGLVLRARFFEGCLSLSQCRGTLGRCRIRFRFCSLAWLGFQSARFPASLNSRGSSHFIRIVRL